MIDNDKLKQAAEGAEELLMAGPLAPEDCPDDFSQDFERKLTQQLMAQKRQMRRANLRRASICVTVILIVAAVYTIMPTTAKAAIYDWRQNGFDTVSMHLFYGNVSGKKLKTYRLSEIPRDTPRGVKYKGKITK